ncbi:hypothetical protein LZ30DRAFT_776615 [Colletotrichum cereale]|nr:hypothetical protein LZ30DRAFT_776615 [Colletotrichum cereale]
MRRGSSFLRIAVALCPSSPRRYVKAVRSPATNAAYRQESSFQVVSILCETHNSIAMNWTGEADLGTLHGTEAPVDMASVGARMDEDDVRNMLKMLRALSSVRTVTHWDFRPSNVVLRFPRENDLDPALTVVD